MNAEDFYREMKNALAYFGLRFAEKDQMQIEFCNDSVVFCHGEREITIHATVEGDEGYED